jgi:dGTPase
MKRESVTLEDVRAHRERLAAFSPSVEADRKQTKEFLYENLYYSSALSDEKDDAERVVRGLFSFWMDHSEALPHNYREKAKEESLPRIICDYIAGMTDPFILEQYEKYCG